MDISSVDHGIMKGFCGAASLDWWYPDNEKSGGCHRMLLGSLQGPKKLKRTFCVKSWEASFFQIGQSSLKFEVTTKYIQIQLILDSCVCVTCF